jgi:hypothetical protein
MYYIDPARVTTEGRRDYEGQKERVLTDYRRDRDVTSRLWSITETRIEATR